MKPEQQISRLVWSVSEINNLFDLYAKSKKSIKSPFSKFFDKPTMFPVDQNYLFLVWPILEPKHVFFQKDSNDSNIGIFTIVQGNPPFSKSRNEMEQSRPV